MTAATARLRDVPSRVVSVLQAVNDAALRRRPEASGEWSAIEVVGHLVDKMHFWSQRVELIAREDRPFLPSYDQDAYVRERQYQSAELATVMDQLRLACEQFAALVDALPQAALLREGVHQEMGPITLEQCITLPLDSVDAHLDQMKAAMQTSAASEPSAPTD